MFSVVLARLDFNRVGERLAYLLRNGQVVINQKRALRVAVLQLKKTVGNASHELQHCNAATVSILEIVASSFSSPVSNTFAFFIFGNFYCSLTQKPPSHHCDEGIVNQ